MTSGTKISDKKIVVAVVGDAAIDGDETKQAQAFELGKLLVENGYRLATGGLRGVMERAPMGARAAANYAEGAIIGVLPGYDARQGNPYLDVALPSGFGPGRNLLLVSLARAVISIGGGAGTLSEIAFAWQMKKLIIALGSDGWSGKLRGTALDERRSDVIFAADTAKQAVALLNANIAAYPSGGFSMDDFDAKR